MAAGCENTDVVFLFSDVQIVEEVFLEDINNILNSGDVPNLYESDEMSKIIDSVRPLAKAVGKVTRDEIYAHYIQLVREKFHMKDMIRLAAGARGGWSLALLGLDGENESK